MQQNLQIHDGFAAQAAQDRITPGMIRHVCIIAAVLQRCASLAPKTVERRSALAALAAGLLVRLEEQPKAHRQRVALAVPIRVRREVDSDAVIIFGSTFDEKLEGVMRVSIVATGIEAATASTQPIPTRTHPGTSSTIQVIGMFLFSFAVTEKFMYLYFYRKSPGT